MALQRATREGRVSSYQEFLAALLIAAAVIAVMVVLTIVFGINRPVPSFNITPDPAGLMPF